MSTAFERAPVQRPFLEVPASKPQTIDPAIISEAERNKDALDLLRKPLNRCPFHNAFRAGVLTAGFATGFLGNFPQPELQHLLYGVTAAGGAEVSRRLRGRRLAKKIDERLANARDLADSLGEPLELIRQNSRRKSRRAVHLYWGAEFSEEDKPGKIRSRLENVAEIAKQSGLKEVVIPIDLLKFVKDDESRDSLTESGTGISQWLKDAKKLPVMQFPATAKKGDLEKGVLQLTPEECLVIASEMEREDPEKPDTFAYAWSALKAERPNHVMFRRHASQYQRLAAQGEKNGVHRHARSTIADQIALTLDDTAVQRGPNLERVRINLRGSIDKRHPIARLQGAQAINTAGGKESVHAEDSGELLQHLGITLTEIAQFFEDPGRLSQKKRIQVAEVVLLYELSGWQLPPHGLHIPIQDSGEADNTESGHSAPLLQESVAIAANALSRQAKKQLSPTDTEAARKVSFQRFDRARLTRFFAPLLLAFALSQDTTGKIVNMPANYLYYQAQAEYINNLGQRDPQEILERINQKDLSEIDRQELQALIDEAQTDGTIPYGLYDDFKAEHPTDPVNAAMGNVYDFDRRAEEVVSEILGNPIATDSLGNSEADHDKARVAESSRDLTDAGNASVGNAAGGENKPLWLLESNNLDTNGYWAQETYDRLLEGESGGQMFWDQSQYSYTLETSDFAPEPVELSSPEEAEASGAYIKVSAVSSLTFDRNYDVTRGRTYRPLPVRAGTMPVAIRVEESVWGSNHTAGNVPASIAQLNNGTFVAIINQGPVAVDANKLELSYWLAPIPENHTLPYDGIRATGPVEGGSYGHSQPDSPDYGLSDADEAVDRHVPGLPQGGIERTKQLARHMRETFDYSLAPFEEIEEGVTEDSQIEGVPDYVDLVFEGGEANCNVANTLIAADNPELVNPVTGFRNNPKPGSYYDTLSIGDRHLWLVDKEGTLHDGTPSSGVSPEDSAFFEENFSAEDFKKPESKADQAQERLKRMMQAAAVTGTLAAAGIAIAKRKKLAQTARNARTGYYNKRGTAADKRFDRITQRRSSELRTSKEIIEHALFGNPKEKLKPSRDLTPVDGAYLRNNLRINQFATAGTKKPLKTATSKLKQAKNAGAFKENEKRTIRLAKKLLKLNHYSSLRSPN